MNDASEKSIECVNILASERITIRAIDGNGEFVACQHLLHSIYGLTLSREQEKELYGLQVQFLCKFHRSLPSRCKQHERRSALNFNQSAELPGSDMKLGIRQVLEGIRQFPVCRIGSGFHRRHMLDLPASKVNSSPAVFGSYFSAALSSFFIFSAAFPAASFQSFPLEAKMMPREEFTTAPLPFTKPRFTSLAVPPCAP